MSIVEETIKILDNHRVSLERILNNDYEVGGYVDVRNQKLYCTSKGNENQPTIDYSNLTPIHAEYPLVDWHSHHNGIPSSVDGLPEGAPRMIPSDTDLITLIRFSTEYKQPCLAVTISKWGYFFVKISESLLDCLITDGLDTHLGMLEEKIKVLNREFFFDNAEYELEERTKRYNESMKNLLKKECGLYCHEVFRNLESPSGCLIG